MMIHRAIITSFGKFHHKTFNFEQGLNVAYGLNEAGKSTLYAFIEGMFFGFFNPQTKTRKYLEQHENYQPKKHTAYEGTLIFTHKDRQYRLYRNFRKQNEKLILSDEKTGEDLTKSIDLHPVTKLPDIAKFLDLPYMVYKNTLSIGQLNLRTDTEGSDELTKRLQNLTTTKTVSLSPGKAIKHLDDQLKAIGSSAARTKPYAQALKTREHLEQALSDAENKHHELLTMKEQLNDLQTKLIHKQAALKHTEEAKQHAENSQKVKAYKVLQAHLAEKDALSHKLDKLAPFQTFNRDDYDQYIQYTERIKAINTQEKDAVLDDATLDQTKHKQNTYRRLLNISMLFACVSFLLFIVLSIVLPWTYYLLLTGLPILCVIFAGLKHREARMKLAELAAQRSQFQETKARQTTYQQGLEKLQKKYNVKDLDELKTYYDQHLKWQESKKDAQMIDEKIDEKLNGRTMEELASSIDFSHEDSSDYSLETLTEDLHNLKEEHSQLKQETIALNTQLETELNRFRPIEEIEADLEHIKAIINRFERETETLEDAITHIQNAVTRIRQQFSPQLNEAISAHLKQFTQGKYTAIKTLPDLSFKVHSPDTNNEEAPHFFSQGTQDQIYLAMRIGILDALNRTDLPLIMDDALTTYDDVRLKHALISLSTLTNRQILLLTCQKREQEQLKAQNIDFNAITID